LAALFFVSFFWAHKREKGEFFIKQNEQKEVLQLKMFYVLSFTCAKERTKEKHTGNDVRPLPDALIKL
jgi:hypothetical protein